MQWDTIRGLRYEGESGCTYLDVETDGTKDLKKKKSGRHGKCRRLKPKRGTRKSIRRSHGNQRGPQSPET